MKLINFFYPKALGFVAPAPAPVAVPVAEDSPVKRVLNEAANIVEERGWCQNSMRDSQGRVCTIGAVIFASRKLYGDIDSTVLNTIRISAVFEVSKLINDQVPYWNDTLLFFGATRVKRVLRQAAKRV